MYGFRIAQAGAHDDAGSLAFAGLMVSHADWLPAIELRDRAGATFGVLLGWPISGESWTLLDDAQTYDCAPADLAAFHRAHIEPLRGSFVAVLAGGGQGRAYLDPFGTLGLVHDPVARLAGGTAADILSPGEYAERFDAPLHVALGVAGDGWFPGGLTAHRGVERLLTNHYLDLDSFAAVRHIDYSDVPMGSGRTEDHLDTIADEVRGMAAALGKAGRPVAMGLTGGADSRMMLAAMRGTTGDVLFYTVDAPGGGFDRTRAGEIAARYGLRHTVLPYVRASTAHSAEWDRRAGHAVATANRTMFPSVDPLRGHACLDGLGGEVGRCFLWPDMAQVPAKVDARTIVDRLKLPRLAAVEARIADWLAGLPDADPHRVLDLAYIELRMSPWAFAQSFANPASLVLHPLGSAAALRAMLALPAAYRQQDGMVRGVIERHWPELLDLPINRYGDARDLRRVLAKLANPGRAWRKLRQMVRTG